MARIGASGSGGASAAAAGNNTDVQFNNSGSFAGSDNFTFDGYYVYGQGFLSQNNLPSGVTLTVSPTDQFIVLGGWILSGTLNIEGQMLVL